MSKNIIKKYVCNICERNYSSSQSLCNHKTIKHKNILSDDITIETPKSTPQNSVPNFIDTSKFYCEYCKKELSRKDNLKRHYSICELKNKYEKKLEEENNKLKHENEELKKMMMELINKNCKVHPKTLEKINYISKPSLEDYFETDGEARNFAASLIQL
jgi:uncharacterized Zn-finger protein